MQEVIIHNLLKLYCDPVSLVIVLNLSQEEQDVYIAQLSVSDVVLPARSITSETPAAERRDVYLEVRGTLSMRKRGKRSNDGFDEKEKERKNGRTR